MTDIERFGECFNCKKLYICNIQGTEKDDENGHCTEYESLLEMESEE